MSNATPPPPPPPHGVVCPNCGAAQSLGVTYCTNCGAPLAPAKKSNGLATAAKVIVGIVLFGTALLFGGIGACLFFVGLMGNNGGGTGTNSTIEGATTGLIMAAIAGVLGIAWTVFWLVKKK